MSAKFHFSINRLQPDEKPCSAIQTVSLNEIKAVMLLRNCTYIYFTRTYPHLDRVWVRAVLITHAHAHASIPIYLLSVGCFSYYMHQSTRNATQIHSQHMYEKEEKRSEDKSWTEHGIMRWKNNTHSSHYQHQKLQCRSKIIMRLTL